MNKGKNTCKILKEIRKQIAEENDIELVTSECTYKGDCEGTCPKCEAEVRYLERELEKRQKLGKAAVFAGIALGTMLTATSCHVIAPPLAGDVVCPTDTTEAPEQPDSLDPDFLHPLEGEPAIPIPDSNVRTIIINEPVKTDPEKLDALVGDI